MWTEGRIMANFLKKKKKKNQKALFSQNSQPMKTSKTNYLSK